MFDNATRNPEFVAASGRNPYHGRGLLSTSAELTFADLFEDVDWFDNRAKGFQGDKRGRNFLSAPGLWNTAYVWPKGVAYTARNIEEAKPNHPLPQPMPCSFEIIDWGNNRALVICKPSSFIGSTWAAFIATDSIPDSPFSKVHVS